MRGMDRLKRSSYMLYLYEEKSGPQLSILITRAGYFSGLDMENWINRTSVACQLIICLESPFISRPETIMSWSDSYWYPINWICFLHPWFSHWDLQNDSSDHHNGHRSKKKKTIIMDSVGPHFSSHNGTGAHMRASALHRRLIFWTIGVVTII